MFPDDVIEMLVSDENEEDVNAENCESVEEKLWIDMMLEELDSLRYALLYGYVKHV